MFNLPAHALLLLAGCGRTGLDSADTPVQAESRAAPVVGVLGAEAGDLDELARLGAILVQIPLPPNRASFDDTMARAAELGVSVMLRIEATAAIQSDSLDLDSVALTHLVNPILADNPWSADPHFAGVQFIDDPCHTDESGRDWTVTSESLAAATAAMKAIDPHITTFIDFSKSSCLNTYVVRGTAGTHLADVALLRAFYYKWSTTPDLVASYEAAAASARAFDPDMRVVPALGLYESVGPEASALPTPQWLRDREAEFAASGLFAGVLLYTYRPTEPVEVWTMKDILGDPDYEAAVKDVLAAGGA